ncbi:MAG: hypothetical protein AMXMBFR13_09380 [Phycisphaerae bacterium]
MTSTRSCRGYLLAALVAGGFGCGAGNAAVSLLGVQYQQDEPFPEYQCFWKDRDYPASCGIALNGANLHVFLKNDGTSAVTLDDAFLAGHSLKYALRQLSLNDHITNSIWFRWDNPPQDILDAGEPAWFKMDPKSVPAGGVGQVIIRLRRVPTTPTVAVSVDTSANVLNTAIEVDAGVPQLANISFAEDLKKVYLYWRRPGGAAPATVMMDGVDVTTTTHTVGDPNTNHAVSVISLASALPEMSYHVFQGIYPDNQRATGGVRCWVNPFVYGSWAAFEIPDGNYTMARAWLDTCLDRGINTLEMNSASGGLMQFLGTGEGKAYADSRNYGFIKDSPDWGTWSKNPRMWFVDDEPDIEEANLVNNFCGTGYKLPCSSNQAGTMGMHFITVGEDLRKVKNRPTTINLDGTWKPYSWYAYGQLTDCLAIDHYYQPKVRHAYTDLPHTLPLYRKATVVYATAKAGARAAEPNPSRQLLYSCQINNDGPLDPWPWAAPETKRIEAYYSMAAGAKGICYWWFKRNPSASNGLSGQNLQPQDPALWREIGLIGAEAKLLQPYLVTSHPVDLDATGSTHVWVRGLARSTDTLILFVVTDDYYNDQGFHGNPISNASVSLGLPSWMISSPMAFEVGRTGIGNVGTSQNGNNLTLSLGTLDVAKIVIVTTDPQLRMTLQQRFDQHVWPGICNFASSVCQQNTSPPSLLAHPSPQSALAGGSATFTMVATGGSQLTYRWQKNSSNLYDGGHYSGCTTPFLTVSSIDGNDVASYRCVVTNPYGTQTSNQAALVISTVSITEHPTVQNVCEGSTAQFSVTATGQGTLSYRWQKNGVNLDNGGPYSGVTTRTLTIADASANDEADYRCAVTDSTSTSYSDAARLILTSAAEISRQPTSQSVVPGATAMLRVEASGGSSLTYQWQKDESDLSEGGHYSGVATATLTISSFAAEDVGGYRCVVMSTGCGSATSEEAVLTINACSPVALLNGSFDDSTSGWSVAPNWTSYSSGSGQFSKNTSVQVSSPNAQEIEPPSSGAGAYAGVRQTVGANVGDAVTFVAWAYQNSPNTYETARLGARFDGSTTPPTSGWQTVTTKQVWTQRNVSGQATTANGVTVFLDVLRGGTGQYWSCFDDVSACWAYVPPAPLVKSPGNDSLGVDLDPGCNSMNSSAEFAISIGGGSYVLGTHWVQADGSVTTGPLWQTDAGWATQTVVGLTAGTQYTFKAKARYSSTYPQESNLGPGAEGTPGDGCAPPGAPLSVSAAPTAICAGENIQLSAEPGAGGDTIEWFIGGCGSTLVSGGGSPTVNPIVPTTYYARTLQSASGCSSLACTSIAVAVTIPVFADFDHDCDVDGSDVSLILSCMSAPQEPQNDPDCQGADLDGDNDVDQTDFGLFQRCMSGSGRNPEPGCED